MSVKITAELNPLHPGREEFTVEPKTIAEIINDLNSGFPASQARVCRSGEIVKDFNTTVQDGDVLLIRFVPYGSPQEAGAGMKAGGWALVGLGALSFLIPGVGGFIGSALIGTGLSMALGGTVMMNIDIPKLKDREKPESDPSIRGGKNQARPHGRIPVLFGRHRIYPDLAANPHTEITGSQQYFIQLFCGGYKDYAIDLDSFKLGDTPLIEFSKTKNINSILSGADPVIRLEILQNGEASNLYPHCVHETVINAPLQHEIDGGDNNKIPGEIIRATPDNTDTINVDIFFHNGLGRYNDDGGLASASVEVRAWYKSSGAPDTSYQSLGFFNGSDNIISGAELKTKRCQVTKSGLTPGQYTVKIERITADSSDSKIIDQVYIGSIRSYKSKRPVSGERQKDLTIIALRVMATAKLNGVIDSFNFIATSKLPVYSGGGSGPLYWLNTAETRNPASALLYALRGRAAQQPVDPDDIDWPSLEAFYNWCEEYGYTCDAYLSESVTIAELLRMIGSTARADILRIDSKISVVQDIERMSPVQLFTPKNSISYSITMFKADIPDAISLRYIDGEAGFAHNELTVYNTPDGNRITEPGSIQKVDLWGITGSVQARRIGMYNYGCLKNRPFVHTIEADIEYLICNKGDWIQYAGDIALTGSIQGRIKGIIWVDDVCVGIDTDEPVVMEEGKQYAVRIRLSDGAIILKDVVFSLGARKERSITYYTGEGGSLHDPAVGELYAVDEDNVYYEPQNIILFTEPLAEQDRLKAGGIYAFGMRGYEALDLIITDIQPGGNFTAVMTCVEYSPEIFGVDSPDFILPEFVNRITPVSGAVDSGVVNPDRWRSFFVYHDGEDEPPHPTGSGQNGGWHHIQTYRSIWQAAKISESIEDGEWGPPVRIKAQRGTDDITPVWLSLSQPSITLETDGDGNILAGLLPLTIQARLFRWNSILTGVTFSLTGAPGGISVNANGLITVNANAVLGDANAITVRAQFQGAVYSASLTVIKNIRNSSPRYLGTITSLPSASSANVTIIKGPVQGLVQARQGDYVLAVAAVSGRQAGSVFQWTGTAWTFRSPDTHADLYMRCFKDGLEVPALADNMEWFGAVIARLLIAQQAFIEELAAQVITLRQGGVIQSEAVDPQTGSPLFKLSSDGLLEAVNAKIKGEIEATSGSFTGHVDANSGTFSDGTFIGITARDIDISGNSTMRGNIDTDVLKVMPSQPHIFDFPGAHQVYNVWVSVRSIIQPGAGIDFTVFPTAGTWNGSQIEKIFFIYHDPSISGIWGYHHINITTVDGRNYYFGYTTINNINFTVGIGGRTVRLVGLPTSTLNAGEVYEYKDPNIQATLLAIRK